MTAGTTLTALQRADLLELFRNLGAILWGPDIARCRRLMSNDDFHALDRLGSVLGPAALDARSRLKTLVQGFADAQALFDSLEEDYIALFVNARGGIAAPLYQSCYPDADTPSAPDALMGEPALRMQQRFAARGLDLDAGLGEPPDHLAVEIEYLYFLLEKGWAEEDAVLIGEAADFVNSEMLVWLPVFEQRLAAAGADSFYTAVTIILGAALRLVVKG